MIIASSPAWMASIKARRSGRLEDLEAALALHIAEAEACERRDWNAHYNEQVLLRTYIERKRNA